MISINLRKHIWQTHYNPLAMLVLQIWLHYKSTLALGKNA